MLKTAAKVNSKFCEALSDRRNVSKRCERLIRLQENVKKNLKKVQLFVKALRQTDQNL